MLVHKKDDNMDKVNYRPMTVLNAVNKVFEKQLSKQIRERSDHQLSIYISATRYVIVKLLC